MKRKAPAVNVDEDASPARHLLARIQGKLGVEQATMADEELPSDITDYVSTQCATLDYIIGQPGIPVGRLTTVFGKEGGGKTTLTLHLIAETQRRGGIAMLLDSECRFSRDRAVRLGVHLDDLIVLSGDTLEKCLTDIEESIVLMREDYPDTLLTIVYDSLAGSPTEATLSKGIGEHTVARAANIVSQSFPRIVPLVARARVALIIVNQLRTYINASGDPRNRERRKVMKTAAMVAEGPLVFYSSLMLYVTSTGLYPDKDNPEGIDVRVEVRKNSIAPGEGKQCEFPISYLHGVDKMEAKLTLLEQLGHIKRSGGWYSYACLDKKFQRKDFEDVLQEFPELEEFVKAAPTLWQSE